MQAYQRWKSAHDDSAPPPQLPGLETLSDEQLFFLSASYFWCNKVRPEEALRRLRTDYHSPNRFRSASSSPLHCTSSRPNCVPLYATRYTTTVNSTTYLKINCRVNGPLHNSEDFSRTFGCSRADPMNSANKCSVW